MEPHVDAKYLSRSAAWSRVDDCLIVHDRASQQAPRMLTMEHWEEVVFMAADGTLTLEQLVQRIAAEHASVQRDALKAQLLSVVLGLVAAEVVHLHDKPSTIPPYFLEDFSDADPEVRRQQMQRDGLIRD